MTSLRTLLIATALFSFGALILTPVPAKADAFGNQTTTVYTSETTSPDIFTGTVNVSSSLPAVEISGTGAKVITVQSGGKISANSALGTIGLDANTGITGITVNNSGTITNVGGYSAILATNPRAGGAYVPLTVYNTGTVSGSIKAGNAGLTYTSTGGVLRGDLTATGGTNTVSLSGNGGISQNVSLGGGTNNVLVDDALIDGTLTTGAGNDTLTITNVGIISGTVNLGDGVNTVTVNNGAIFHGLMTGAGADVVNITNESYVSDSVNLGAGGNTLYVENSTLWGGLTTGAGNDTVTISGTSGMSGNLVDSSTGDNDTLTLHMPFALYLESNITNFEAINLIAPEVDIVGNITGAQTLTVGAGTTTNVYSNLTLSGALTAPGALHIGPASTLTADTVNLTGGHLIVDVGTSSTAGKLVLTNASTGMAATSITIAMAQNGGFITNGTSYTIVSSTATGTLSDLANTGLLYTYGLSLNGNNTVLTLNRVSTSAFVSSTSGKLVANTIDAFATPSGTMATLQDAIANQTTAKGIQDTIESASPNLNTLGTTALTIGRASTQQITNRLASLRGTGLEGVAAGDMTDRNQLWVQAFANGQSHDDTAENYGYDGTSHGMVLGWDTSYFEGVTTGWAFSYGSGSVDSNAPGSASNDVKSYTLNLYGSQMLGNGAFVSGLVGAGYDQYDTKRTILGVGSATGSTTGYHATARLEAGVDVPLWDIVTLTPLIGTQYTYASMDKYTEEGAGNAGLMVKPGTMGTLDMTAGLELKTYIPLSDFSYLRPSLRLAYTRRTGDDAFSTTSQFIAGGQTFTSNGFGDSKNFITVGGALGLINSQGTDLSLSYDAELRDAMFGYSAQMKAKFMF